MRYVVNLMVVAVTTGIGDLFKQFAYVNFDEINLFSPWYFISHQICRSRLVNLQMGAGDQKFD